MTSRRPPRLASRAVALAIATGLVFGAGGCGLDKIDWAKIVENLQHPRKKKKHHDDDDDDSKKVEPTDLGVAAYPSTATSPTKRHEWSASALDPEDYAVTYVLAPDAAVKVEMAYQDFAHKVRFDDLGSGKYRWVPPPGCPKDMGCVFEALVEENREQMLPLVQIFRERKKTKKLDAMELAALVVAFVQNIDYQIPEKEPFGVLAPALIVSLKHGDCDSKSLLAHILLKELGYDTIMLSSNAHSHSMLGIALPVSGEKMHYGGRDYAFAEMTAKGSPIGHINRDLLQPNDWVVVPLESPLPSWKP